MTEPTKLTSVSWQKFLATEHGTKGLLILNEQQPVIARGDEHEMIFDAGRVEGYRECLRRIDNLQIVSDRKSDSADTPGLN